MTKFAVFVILFFSVGAVFAQGAENALPTENASAETAAVGESAPAAAGNRAGQGFLAAPAQRGDVWICPGAETAFFSLSGVSVGGSLAVAYGSRVSLGFKAAWFFDMNNELDALELNFLLRFYLMGGAASAKRAASTESSPPTESSLPKESAVFKGPYLQLTGGPALFFAKAESASLPAKWGTVSAGLTFGWRFMFGRFFFAEPYIRAGYPYIFGAGASAGVRF